MNQSLLESLRRSRIVAILRMDDLTDADPIVDALLSGGIRFIEFTMTNSKASSKVAELRKRFASMEQGTGAIGLGSVRTIEEAKIAVDSGAQFVVCPITDAKVIAYCKANQVPIMPGAMTPSEMQQAWTFGADVIKLFPATSLGPSYLKDVLAPMPYLPVMPTGGVTLGNMQSYFDVGAIAVGVGSNLLPKQAILSKDWATVQAVAAEYARAASIPMDSSDYPIIN